MSTILAVSAYANNEVALIAWSLDAPIPGCLGFEVTRVYLTPGDADTPAGTRRVLASWLPFEGQDNPQWNAETTSVWPIQKMFWRDLTVRQRRDQATLHDDGVSLQYVVRPVGAAAPGLPPVALDPAAPPYVGAPLALAYLGAPVVSNAIKITSDYGAIRAAFNNGILSTQWLKRTFEKTLGKPLSKASLLPVINDLTQPIRAYMAGDAIAMLSSLLLRAQNEPGSKLYMALYELSDPGLFALMKACAPQIHLILSNSSMDAKTKLWDTENAPDRAALHQLPLAEQCDRLFNNSGHIGHNKFVVFVDAANQPQATLTGSTNWTANGLCAQSNNAMLIESPELAKQYLDYWQNLRRDNETYAQPASIGAATVNKQGPQLRQANAERLQDVALDASTTLTLWRSPNTVATTKGSATPPDLAEVFSLMRKAKASLFFAVFLPSAKGDNSIISEAIDIARLDTQLLVYGSISAPIAMPNYVPKPKAGAATQDDDDSDDAHSSAPGTFDEGNVHIVRASALTSSAADTIGDFESELLSAGFAIIHDKILVIDPLSPDCVVVLGSHNFGFRASYANDDNLLIVRGNQALAQAYMVHTLDLYEHYRFRALQSDQPAAAASAVAPAAPAAEKWDGKLRRDDQWQANYFGGSHQTLVDYLVADK